VPGPTEREKALAEMARVLKPGGQILLQDFRYSSRYVDEFRRLGLVNVGRRMFQWRIFPPAAIVTADKPG
jgi:ubiquinone/menaquinone biosynthesis C-methylase UbiE